MTGLALKKNGTELPNRILLGLSFIVPVQPLLQFGPITELKTYRVVELIILIMLIVAALTKQSPHIPKTIRVSFWIGLFGWALATAFSNYPLRSLDVGALEFFIPFCVLYLFLAYAPDRQFMVKAGALFVLGVLLVSAYQAFEIISAYGSFLVFPSAGNFLLYKAALPVLLPSGVRHGYGNIDNYASLWALLIPLLAGSILFVRKRYVAGIALATLLYLGLFTYSRGALLSVMAALLTLLYFHLSVKRKISRSILSILALLGLIHMDSSILSYFASGVSTFSREVQIEAQRKQPQDKSASTGAATTPTGDTDAQRLKTPSNDVDIGSAPILSAPATQTTPLPGAESASDLDVSTVEQSGEDRAESWRTGLTIAKDHWLSGVGYGVYPIIEPKFTAPHTMLLMRFAESGVFGLLSFLILALYSPYRLVQDRSLGMFEITCLVAISAFMVKAAIFGASFSVSSNIVWGFGCMMLMAASLIPKEAIRTGRAGNAP
ncbi:O-antigen ligase family protein [Tardiphaga sp.]|uniref:O-antigen ligase family protein n=1 Tax=Tardiphaga sp. TaxID=1926292 RepID=UPI0037DA4FD8